MNKLVNVALCMIASALLGAMSQSPVFSNYKAVEAYEIHPGVLAMPSYTAEGQVCEVGVQRRIYSPGNILLDGSLSNDEIDQIVDELAPSDERGPKTVGLINGNMTVINGKGYSHYSDYANVSVATFGETSATPKQKYVTENNYAVRISWKNRKCK